MKTPTDRANSALALHKDNPVSYGGRIPGETPVCVCASCVLARDVLALVNKKTSNRTFYLAQDARGALIGWGSPKFIGDWKCGHSISYPNGDVFLCKRPLHTDGPCALVKCNWLRRFLLELAGVI